MMTFSSLGRKKELLKKSPSNNTIYQRTIYGTVLGRAPYPNATNLNIVSNSAGTILGAWLSDYVYTGDSNIDVTVQPGVYTITAPPTPSDILQIARQKET